MTKAYLLGLMWADQSDFAEHHRRKASLLDKYGGRYLVVGGAPAVIQGDECPKSVVLLEFPTREAAKSFYNDPEYEPLVISGSLSSKELHFVLVDGDR